MGEAISKSDDDDDDDEGERGVGGDIAVEIGPDGSSRLSGDDYYVTEGGGRPTAISPPTPLSPS